MMGLQGEEGKNSTSRLPFHFHYGYVILVIGILTVTGALGFARFGYTTILPSMKAGLNFNNAQMGMIATGNLIGYTAFSLIGGFLASRFGPRIIIVFSMFLAGTTMILTGLANGFAAALLFRFITGLGSAGSNIPVMGLASAWFAPRRRGMAAGFLVGGSGVALVVTGFLVPGVINAWPENGWRISWFILGGLVVLLGILSYVFLRNNPAEKGLLPVGAEAKKPEKTAGKDISEARSNSGQGANGKTVPAKTGKERIRWGSVYASAALWHLGLVYFMFGFSYIIYGTFFSATLISDKGLSQASAGSMWALVGVISIFSGILWGTISDYLGRKYALAMIFGLQAICYALMAGGHAHVTLLVSAILFGLTCWSIPGVVAAACGDYVGARLAPAALGMVTLCFAVGQAAAPSVAGYLADLKHSFSPALFLAAGVAALGSLGSLSLRPPKVK